MPVKLVKLGGSYSFPTIVVRSTPSCSRQNPRLGTICQIHLYPSYRLPQRITHAYLHGLCYNKNIDDGTVITSKTVPSSAASCLIDLSISLCRPFLVRRRVSPCHASLLLTCNQPTSMSSRGALMHDARSPHETQKRHAVACRDTGLLRSPLLHLSKKS
jgi:hypothetical protein